MGVSPEQSGAQFKGNVRIIAQANHYLKCRRHILRRGTTVEQIIKMSPTSQQRLFMTALPVPMELFHA